MFAAFNKGVFASTRMPLFRALLLCDFRGFNRDIYGVVEDARICINVAITFTKVRCRGRFYRITTALTEYIGNFDRLS